MTLDYTKYGIDPDQALPAAQQEAFVSLEAAALEAEANRDACDDEEDREILAERADEARAKADAARKAQKITKAEARQMRRTLISNNLRAAAQHHLSLEAQKATASDHDLLVLEAEQDRVEGNMAVLERIFAANA